MLSLSHPTNLLVGVASHLALLHLISQARQCFGRIVYLHIKSLPSVKDFEGLDNGDVGLNPYYLWLLLNIWHFNRSCFWLKIQSAKFFLSDFSLKLQLSIFSCLWMPEINFSPLWYPLWPYQGSHLKFIFLLLWFRAQSANLEQTPKFLNSPWYCWDPESWLCPAQREVAASKLGCKSGPDELEWMGIICTSV